MSKTRFDESIGRGQKIRTETMGEKEKLITGPGRPASFLNTMKGGATDISHSISDGKVKRLGKG